MKDVVVVAVATSGAPVNDVVVSVSVENVVLWSILF